MTGGSSWFPAANADRQDSGHVSLLEVLELDVRSSDSPTEPSQSLAVLHRAIYMCGASTASATHCISASGDLCKTSQGSHGHVIDGSRTCFSHARCVACHPIVSECYMDTMSALLVYLVQKQHEHARGQNLESLSKPRTGRMRVIRNISIGSVDAAAAHARGY